MAGHPFDTVKVRLQSTPSSHGTLRTFAGIVKHEKVLCKAAC